MTTKTPTPQRMRLKQAMTATAFRFVEIRQVWRMYLRGLGAERRDRHRT